jgi:Ca2+-binding EF-hand superfamily protein
MAEPVRVRRLIKRVGGLRRIVCRGSGSAATRLILVPQIMERGAAMTSEILVRRYDKIFSLHDSNGNGYVEEADVKRLQGQFLAMFGESPTSERGADVVKLWDDLWQAMLAAMDLDVDGRISGQEWQEGHARLAGDEASYNRVFTPVMTATIRLLDTDGDGKVGPAEWRSAQESLGNGDTAEASFQRMDTNHNGYLTVEELIDAMHEYYTNPDPDARGGWFFGDV